MTLAVLTPERRGSLVELGNGRWKKQILPLDSITYKGRKITFDRNYFSELVKSFRNKACGPVPLQIADADNRHTNDPLRRHGTVVDLEEEPDGLYAIVELDAAGEELVKGYPDIGVSARIYENYERSDGNFFKAAIQHVLATLDPHIVGMRPWQAVALSNDVSGPVIDLSDSEFYAGEEEEGTLATKNELKEILAKLRESGDEAELTDEELDQLLAITDAMSPNANSDDELSDEELDQLIAAAESELEGDDTSNDDNAEDDPDSEPEPDEEGGDPVTHTDPQLIAASRQHQRAIELANQRIQQQAVELAAVQAKLDATEFEAEQRTLAEKYGIPPRITEFARPLLEGRNGTHVIQLASGDQVDAGAVMRKVLTELGETFKALDLSQLIGNGLDEPIDDEDDQRQKSAEETRNWVSQIRDSYSF